MIHWIVPRSLHSSVAAIEKGDCFVFCSVAYRRAIRLLPTDVVWSGQTRLPVSFWAYLDEPGGKKSDSLRPLSLSLSLPGLAGPEASQLLGAGVPRFCCRGERAKTMTHARKAAPIVPPAGSLPPAEQMPFAPGLFRPIGRRFQNASPKAIGRSNAISRF